MKYFNPAIKTAYKAIEVVAARTLCQMLPAVLQADYQSLLMPDEADRVHRELVIAADKRCAYLKCLEERGAGHPEFVKAEKALRASVEARRLHLAAPHDPSLPRRTRREAA